jgi:hypothetical protein
VEQYNLQSPPPHLSMGRNKLYANLTWDHIEGVFPGIDLNTKDNRRDTSIFFQMPKTGVNQARDIYDRFHVQLKDHLASFFPSHALYEVQLAHGTGIALRIPAGILELGRHDDIVQGIVKQFRRMLAVAEMVLRPSPTNEELLMDAVQASLHDSEEARLERLRARSASKEPPPKIVTTTVTHQRSADVIAEALLRSKGICGRCGNTAPFKSARTGMPFLEVHHIKPLSENGLDIIENVIALCPNCHRNAHYGPDALLGTSTK